MTILDRDWDSIRPSTHTEAAGLLHRAPAVTRTDGALRYRCPTSDSFVLITDEATLTTLSAPRSRVLCPACGEMHLLTQGYDGSEAAGFVAGPAKP